MSVAGWQLVLNRADARCTQQQTLKQQQQQERHNQQEQASSQTHVRVLLMASMAVNWLSTSGQGCLPVSISSTVQPRDQMSALRPVTAAGMSEDE